MTKFIGVISAKGGVGKTTTTVNLSSALHLMNRQVIALDANFANPDLGIHMGLPLAKKNLHSALKGHHDIKDSVYKHSTGLRIVPGSISYKEARTVKRDNLLELIYGLVGTSELVIIDSTPGIGRDARAVIRACDYLIIVTTPDLVSVSSSLKMVGLAREEGRQIIGVIINKQRGEGYEMADDNISEFLNNRILGVIPDDPEVSRSMHGKRPLVFANPYSKATMAYKKAAALMIGEKYVTEIEKQEEKSVFSHVLNNLGFKRFK